MTHSEKHSTARVIAPPPLIYGVALAAGWLLHELKPIQILRNRNSVNWALGTIFVLAGIGISTAVVSAFGRSGTPVSPLRPTNSLVVSGPYRLSRNPDYLGQLLTYTGASMVANSWWPIVMLPVVIVAIDRGVIRREERYLEKMFGQTYRDYAATVRRWV